MSSKGTIYLRRDSPIGKQGAIRQPEMLQQWDYISIGRFYGRNRRRVRTLRLERGH
jgi:hypothetical protein